MDQNKAAAEAEGATPWPAQAEKLGSVHIDEVDAVMHLHQLDQRSHGESFMEMFARRIHPGGLYLLDEPEAPLSVKRQISLVRLLMAATEKGAQFIIATHSPLLLSTPGARVLAFDSPPIQEVAYEDLDNVKLARDFLLDPAAFIRDS